MNGKLFWTAGRVAYELGMKRSAFLRRRTTLEDDHGFPLPLPQQLRPLLWRADQILAWRDTQGLPRRDTIEIPMGGNVILLEEARRA